MSKAEGIVERWNSLAEQSLEIWKAGALTYQSLPGYFVEWNEDQWC